MFKALKSIGLLSMLLNFTKAALEGEEPKKPVRDVYADVDSDQAAVKYRTKKFFMYSHDNHPLDAFADFGGLDAFSL